MHFWCTNVSSKVMKISKRQNDIPTEKFQKIYFQSGLSKIRIKKTSQEADKLLGNFYIPWNIEPKKFPKPPKHEKLPQTRPKNSTISPPKLRHKDIIILSSWITKIERIHQYSNPRYRETSCNFSRWKIG